MLVDRGKGYHEKTLEDDLGFISVEIARPFAKADDFNQSMRFVAADIARPLVGFSTLCIIYMLYGTGELYRMPSGT